MKRVLQVTGGLGRGGAESMVMALYRAVDRARVQFDFLVYQDAETAYAREAEGMGARVFRMGPGMAGYGRGFAAIAREAGGFDAVHAHNNLHEALPLSAARRLGIPVRIAHAHTTNVSRARGPVRRAYRWAMRREILRSATVLAACGQEAGRALYRAAFEARGIVLPNAVDLAPFEHAAGGQAMRASLGADAGTLLVGSVASFKEAKNHAFMLDVMQSLLARGVRARIVFAGDGPLRPAIQAQAEARLPAGHYDFLGEREDVPAILAALDVLLMPSLYEGFPVTLVEAQAAGTRALLSDVITPSVDFGLGLVRFLPLSAPAEAWAHALADSAVLSAPPFAARAHAIAGQGYDMRDVAARYMALLGV